MKKHGAVSGPMDAEAWAARLDAGFLDEDEARQLRKWLAEDPRREGALVRAQAILALFDKAEKADTSSEDNDEVAAAPGWRRRAVLGAGGGLIAASAVGLALFYRHQAIERQHFATGPGEIQQLTLNDGTRSVVSARTVMWLEFTDKERHVALDQGAGWFHVAKDRLRPFVIAAGEVRVKAIGTAFAVSREDDGTRVVVNEGIVQLEAPSGSINVVAGDRALVSRSGAIAVERLSNEEVARELAWRQGQISLDGDTLVSAATRFNRFNQRRIVIQGPTLAQERVVGWFKLNDPEAFGTAVAKMFSATVELQADRVVLTRNI